MVAWREEVSISLNYMTLYLDNDNKLNTDTVVAQAIAPLCIEYLLTVMYTERPRHAKLYTDTAHDTRYI